MAACDQYLCQGREPYRQRRFCKVGDRELACGRNLAFSRMSLLDLPILLRDLWVEVLENLQKSSRNLWSVKTQIPVRPAKNIPLRSIPPVSKVKLLTLI